MNRKLAATSIAVLGLGIVAGTGVYAFEKYKEQQAFEALLKDCGSCANRHSAHLRNKALEEQMQADALKTETSDSQN
jgi:AhpD family alkylhydroperoxidase